MDEWVREAVPSGVEIAHVVLERLGTQGRGWWWAWSDYDGMKICPRVSVWLDGYQDWDYEQFFLLRVWTHSEAGPDGYRATTTDHLAVYQRHAGTSQVDVEWRQDPRLFFDADAEWTQAGLHWWVDLGYAMKESAHGDWDPTGRTREFNERVYQEERDKARAIGVVLPYMR